jgi:hypothetical protein
MDFCYEPFSTLNINKNIKGFSKLETYKIKHKIILCMNEFQESMTITILR